MDSDPTVNEIFAVSKSRDEVLAACGRRMLLAAIILAGKVLEDRSYSNRAWSKITGLSIKEINANELAFLRVLDHELFIPVPNFQLCESILARKTKGFVIDASHLLS